MMKNPKFSDENLEKEKNDIHEEEIANQRKMILYPTSNKKYRSNESREYAQKIEEDKLEEIDDNNLIEKQILNLVLNDDINSVDSNNHYGDLLEDCSYYDSFKNKLNNNINNSNENNNFYFQYTNIKNKNKLSYNLDMNSELNINNNIYQERNMKNDFNIWFRAKESEREAHNQQFQQGPINESRFYPIFNQNYFTSSPQDEAQFNNGYKMDSQQSKYQMGEMNQSMNSNQRNGNSLFTNFYNSYHIDLSNFSFNNPQSSSMKFQNTKDEQINDSTFNKKKPKRQKNKLTQSQGNQSQIKSSHLNSSDSNSNNSRDHEPTQTFEDLMNQIQAEGFESPSEYIKTQKGSRDFQKILGKIPPATISYLIQMLYQNLPELMLDKYGNYFCQKLIQNCSPEQRIEILKSVEKHFCRISCDIFGTHSLQLLVEISNIEKEQDIIIDYIDRDIQALAADQRGTHIIQKFISSCINENIQRKLDQIIIKNFFFLISNSHGVCILIKMIKFSSCQSERENLIKLVIQNGLEVIQNPFGNYVVQTLLNDYYNTEYFYCQKILEIISENFFSLSMQKFSSNVVENSLRFFNVNILKKILEDVIISGKISSMIKNTYGNFVIEKLIKKLNFQDKQEIINNVNMKLNEKGNMILCEIFSK